MDEIVDNNPSPDSSHSRERGVNPWVSLAGVGCAGVVLIGVILFAFVYVLGNLQRADSNIDNGRVVEFAQPAADIGGTDLRSESQSESVDDASRSASDQIEALSGSSGSGEFIPSLESDPSHVESAEPVAGTALEFGQFFWKPNSYGGVRIFGELFNYGSIDAGDIRILVTLKDEVGEDLISQYAPFHLDVVPAGGMTPFQIVMVDAPVDFDRMFLEATGLPLDEESAPIYGRYHQIELLRGHWIDEGNYYRIEGEVQNSGDGPTELVAVLIAGYTNDGVIRLVEWSFIDADRLEPGEAATFEVHYIDPDVVVPDTLVIFSEGWIVHE